MNRNPKTGEMDDLSIKVIETVTVGWGQYDEITDSYQFTISGNRLDLSLMWNLMIYHLAKGNRPIQVVNDIRRLRLSIHFGDPIKGATPKRDADAIETLYGYLHNHYPAGYNPFNGDLRREYAI